MNLIHLEDCIRIIKYIIEKQQWGKIINGVFPMHPTKKEYYHLQATKLGLTPPSYDQKDSEVGGKLVKSKYFLINNEVFMTGIN